nr:EOG090X0C57 [Eulimnadia texana]
MAAGTQQALKNAITLKGSADIVTEYFDYAINSILYQRGVFPAQSFVLSPKYDLQLYMNTLDDVKNYLNGIFPHIKEWLAEGKVSKLVLGITDIYKKETVECWEFRVENEKVAANGEAPKLKTEADKDLKEIQKGIREVIRQITASVTFLPLLEGTYSFNVQVIVSKDADAGTDWQDGAALAVSNPQQVKLRSFTTALHNVHTFVNYQGPS